MSSRSPYSGVEPAPPHDPPREPGPVERGLWTVARRFAIGTVVVCAVWAGVSVGSQVSLAVISAGLIVYGAVFRPLGRLALVLGLAGLILLLVR
jgi:hypothetical protein